MCAARASRTRDDVPGLAGARVSPVDGRRPGVRGSVPGRPTWAVGHDPRAVDIPPAARVVGGARAHRGGARSLRGRGCPIRGAPALPRAADPARGLLPRGPRRRARLPVGPAAPIHSLIGRLACLDAVYLPSVVFDASTA